MQADRLADLLKRHFGYDTFRPGQEAVIASALAGQHNLVVMPTGGGKSLCYQLPALALGGVTLVISPLIALMKDQVDSLRANGVPAEFLNSSLDQRESIRVERAAQAGDVRLLYAAPERVNMPGFRRFLGTLDLRLIAIDEAHCISEWGHDFRPDYRELSSLLPQFPDTPIMALTATATERVRRDIVAQLGLPGCRQFVSGFDRHNLSYRVRERRGAGDALVALLDERRGQSAVVYCFSRKDTEELAARLTSAGHPTLAYHAGLDAETRRRTQERFIDGEVPVIAATIAFGMGIDKPDIRLVVHHSLPRSVEGYYQETGRAGRDGLPSDCVLFFSEGDRAKHQHFIREISDIEARSAAESQLQRMVEYARLQTCRRKFLLAYFGEDMGGGSCGNCDVCLAEKIQVDVTVVAQKMLSAVIRTGERFGIAHVSDVLLGSKRERIRELGHHNLSVFGIVDDYHRDRLREIADAMVERGLLARSEDQYATISVTPSGRGWLKSRQSLALDLRVEEPTPRVRQRTESVAVSRPARSVQGMDSGLFERLRTLRRRLADEQGVPAFVVFNDATLRAMAESRPTGRDAMLRVSGVGPAKLQRYGDEFLAEINRHLRGTAIERPVPSSDSRVERNEKGYDKEAIRSKYPRAYEPWTDEEERELSRLVSTGRDVSELSQTLGRQPGAIESRLRRMEQGTASPTAGETHTVTQRLLQQGLTLDQIAGERGLSPSTILVHLERLAEAGETVAIDALLPSTDRMVRIRAALLSAGHDKLKPVKEILGDGYSYDEIRIVRLAVSQVRDGGRPRSTLPDAPHLGPGAHDPRG